MNNNDRSLFKHSAMALYNSEIHSYSKDKYGRGVINLISNDNYVIYNESYLKLLDLPEPTIKIPENLHSFIKHWKFYNKSIYSKHIDCIKVLAYNDRIFDITGINYTSKAYTQIIYSIAFSFRYPTTYHYSIN